MEPISVSLRLVRALVLSHRRWEEQQRQINAAYAPLSPIDPRDIDPRLGGRLPLPPPKPQSPLVEWVNAAVDRAAAETRRGIDVASSRIRRLVTRS